MEFVETELFTKQLMQIGVSDDGYNDFQLFLTKNPASGALIQNSAGIRKARMRLERRGKSRSIRVLYLWLDSVSMIILITAYTKSKRKNLTQSETQAFRRLAQTLKDYYGRRT
jgi:hypothetical protein